MALTPFRWVVAVVAACLICSIVYLRPEPIETSAPRPGSALEQTRWAYAGQARYVARKLRTAQIIDSIRPELARAGAPIRMHLGASVPGHLKGALDTLVMRATGDVSSTGRIGVDVFVIYDTLSMLRGAQIGTFGATADYLLPERSGDRCAVVLRFGRDLAYETPASTAFRSEQAAQQLLGPCGFYRAFGLPGQQIDAWLRRSGWAFAGDGSWTTAASPMAPDNIEFRSTFMFFETPLSFLSIDGAHCLMKETEACERVVFATDTSRRRRMTFLGTNVLSTPYLPLGFARSSYRAGGALGRRHAFLMADMVRTVGRDRFARFWTSEESPSAAFKSATGESITDWTSRWIANQYGPAAPNGPVPSPLIAIASAVLIAIGVFAGIRISAGRQIA
jgi:hypothetical protein